MEPLPPLDPPSTLVVGVLGGIASGKSRVARLLAEDPAGRDRSGLVVDADELAHAVLASAEGAAFVRERFGAAALGEDGAPSRAALGRLAFHPESGPEARRALEDWIHPRVRARIFALLEEARTAKRPVCVLDVPLLLENDPAHGLAGACDVLVFVDAPLAARDERAVRTRGWPAGEVARREAAQLPLEAKRDRADHVLQNTGTLEDLDRGVRELRTTLGLA